MVPTTSLSFVPSSGYTRIARSTVFFPTSAWRPYVSASEQSRRAISSFGPSAPNFIRDAVP
eukprot:3243254-Rhodomonas_salina.1